MPGVSDNPVRKRSFSRRRFLVSAGAALGVVGLFGSAGCQNIQSALSGKPSAGSAVTLRYMGHFTALGDTARDRAQKQIEDKFREKHANITIQWEQTAFQTIGEKYMAAWSANTAPDISLFSPANITPVVRLGSLENLTPAFEQWPDQDKKDFNKAWWDTGTYEGKKYVAPLLLFGSMLVYRKSMFEKAGVNYQEIRSWKDYVAALQKVTVDSKGRPASDPQFDTSDVQTWGFTQAMARGGTIGMPMWFYMHQDRLGRYDVGPPDWKADHWTSPEIVEAAKFIVDWIKTYKIQSVASLTQNSDDAQNVFNSGRVASYQWGTHQFGPAREKFQFPSEDIAWARHPTWDGKRWGPVFTDHWSMGVSSRSKAKDHALTTTSFWMGPEADLILSDVASQQPKRASSTKSPIFERPDLSFVKLFDESARDWSVPLLSSPVRPSEIVIQAYHSMVNENVPVETALADARDAYNKLLADIPADQIPKY